MKLSSIILKWRRIFLLCFLLGFSMFAISNAWATSFSGKAGCVPLDMGLSPVGTVLNNAGKPLESGSLLQFISVGPNQIIDGPQINAILNGDPILSGDDTLISKQVVGDSFTGNFTKLDGKFWYSIDGGLTNTIVNKFYVRAWDIDKAHYNDSPLFSVETADIGKPPAGNHPLGDFTNLFPYGTVGSQVNLPTQPVPSTPVITTFDKPTGKYTAKIQWNSCFNARKYVINQIVYTPNPDLSKPPVPKTIPDLKTIDNAEGRCSVDGSMVLSFTWTGLEELTDYYFKIQAANSLSSNWSDIISFKTLAFPDPTTPIAVTDLQATTTKDEITLTWSPPYDTNGQNKVAACASYDIRVSNETIVSSPSLPFDPSQTNPVPLDTWKDAVSIDKFKSFSSPPKITDPKEWDGTGKIKETITIKGVPSGTYFFALKAKDFPVAPAPEHESYVSNVAGVTVGGGSLALPDIHDLAIEGVDATTVKLSWKSTDDKNKGVKIFASSSSNIDYEEITKNADTKIDPTTSSAALSNQTGEKYYRVVPEKGTAPIGLKVKGGSPAGTTPSETVARKVYIFKPGINTFSYPFSASPVGVYVKAIVTVKDLISELNAELINQKKDTTTQVTVFGQWKNDQTNDNIAVGYLLSGGKVVKNVPQGNNLLPDNFALENNTPYQISLGPVSNASKSEAFNLILLGKL